MPTLADSAGPWKTVEFDMIVSSEVGQLADPAHSASKKRKKRGKYVRYTPEQRAIVLVNNIMLLKTEKKEPGIIFNLLSLT